MQTILKIDEPIFSVGMSALEKSTGNSGIDAKIIADIHSRAHSVMRALGLDTADTTGRELYHSLIAAVSNRNIEELLFESDYVLYLIGDDIVSFNLIDAIENAHHELPYENQTVGHGQRSLRGEIVKRYIEHARTDNVTTEKLAASIGLMPESDSWYNNNANT